MKVFILESPNPMDLIQDRSEMFSLEKICKLFGHEVHTFLIKSRKEFVDTIDYISSIDFSYDNKKSEDHLCIHISSHGSEKGVQFGKDFIGWDDLYNDLKSVFSMFSEYSGERILIISSCGSAGQTLTTKIEDELSVDYELNYLPKYIFTAGGKDIDWKDAVLCWTIFYRKIDSMNLEDNKEFKTLLCDLYDFKIGEIVYFRWDDKIEKYRHFTPVDKKKSSK
jgi:hypothetical protein